MMQPPEVELFDPVFKANPYPTYARLRSEAPLHRVGLPDGQGVWLVTRYDDVVAVLKDERFAKDWRNALTPEQLARRLVLVVTASRMSEAGRETCRRWPARGSGRNSERPWGP